MRKNVLYCWFSSGWRFCWHLCVRCARVLTHSERWGENFTYTGISHCIFCLENNVNASPYSETAVLPVRPAPHAMGYAARLLWAGMSGVCQLRRGRQDRNGTGECTEYEKVTRVPRKPPVYETPRTAAPENCHRPARLPRPPSSPTPGAVRQPLEKLDDGLQLCSTEPFQWSGAGKSRGTDARAPPWIQHAYVVCSSCFSGVSYPPSSRSQC